MATVLTNKSTSFEGPLVQAVQSGQPLSVGRMAVQAMLVIALLLTNMTALPGNILFFGILIVMVASSPVLAFKALTIGVLGLTANQAIVPKTPLWTVARFVIPMICFVRFSLDLQSVRATLFKQAYFIALIAFIIVAACLSILTGYFVEIALLKVFNFAVATMAMLSGAHVLRIRRTDLTEWYVTIALVTVALGFGSIAANIGYNMKGVGTFTSTFNGPFYHSNCLGPIAAMMVVYLASVTTFGRYRNRWICVFLAGCLIYFMALTQSRTSFVSLFTGLAVTFGLAFAMKRRGLIRLRMNMSRAAILSMLLAAGIAAVIADAATGNTISRAVVAFANKGGKTEGFSLDQALSSRKAVVQQSWDNFVESPMIGIGFEVAKTEFFQRNASLFYAPIEKGFLPVAVLEETGVIGAFFFVLFLVAYLGYLGGNINIPGIAMFITFLAVNCGEAMFFAVGGHGAFGWLWFIGGMMLGDYCVERIGRPSARPLAA